MKNRLNLYVFMDNETCDDCGVTGAFDLGQGVFLCSTCRGLTIEDIYHDQYDK